MRKREMGPVHPGKILLEEFMKRSGFSQYRLAKELCVSPIRISEIIRGKRAITADTAIRLGRLFKMEPLFWMNLQNAYDLDIAFRQYDQPVYQRIKPLGQEPEPPPTVEKSAAKPRHIVKRYAKSSAKQEPASRDFSTLLQEGLDRIFVNFQVDKKLRK